MTTRGFFSVVAHHDEAGKVLVRARAREDLEALAEIAGPFEVLDTPDHDYRWRAIMPRVQWSTTLVLLATEIDYPNFKDAVARRQGEARERVYHEVWRALRALQRRR